MDCPTSIPCVTRAPVTRRKEFDEQVSFLASKGTHERIEAVLREGETKADFLRASVNEKIKRAARRRAK